MLSRRIAAVARRAEDIESRIARGLGIGVALEKMAFAPGHELRPSPVSESGETLGLIPVSCFLHINVNSI
jgi:hypothetical protein